ncbi:hypothetical protein RYZ26_17175 [Terasakiella sp. A23]|uniref:hypothetical protein n=1 Tax=Terasakiella sp. FCG-A23 TaxID=3080561 RepID=UPI002955DE51|nr:hypothetical protein [Terasakiella sp. A23]MDV7341344.1 hypothetical protein [Terasakiella sp. A23]
MKKTIIEIEQNGISDLWNVRIQGELLCECGSIKELVQVLKNKKIKGAIWLSFFDRRLPQGLTAFHAVTIREALFKLSTDIAEFINVAGVSKADFIKAKWTYRSRSIDGIALMLAVMFVSANFFAQNGATDLIKPDFSPAGFQAGKPITFNPVINSSSSYSDDENPAVTNLKQARETQRKIIGLPPKSGGTKHE